MLIIEEKKGVDDMQNLIIGTHKDNYYIATAFLYKILGGADLTFSRADKIVDTLKECSGTKYKNIYVIAMRIKEDYIAELIEVIKKLLEEKKQIKWYVLPDRVHIKDKADKAFFQSILKISEEKETLVDTIKKDFYLTETDDYKRLNKLYNYIDKREIIGFNLKKKKKCMELTEEEKIMEQYSNYIEYVRYNYFRDTFEGINLLKKLIEKLAYNSLSPEDIKISFTVDFYKKHISGESRIIKELNKKINKIGRDPDLFVVIYGETGTGKEVVARMLHEASGRTGLFVPLNCAAIPEQLMESLLFGYVAGAHSTATKDKKGVFEEADGGTVFLDEIGDMPLYLQAKLLRVLEEKEVRKLGGESSPINIDFRLICATNKNLRNLVKENKFRRDLYFRIARYELTIPPLRQRKEDIEILALEILYDFYLRGKCGRIILNKKQIDALKSYDWSEGNIRELQAFLERAIIDDDFDFDRRIKEYILKKEADVEENKDFELRPFSEWEREIIVNTFKKCDCNITRTAEELQIAKNTLKTKLREYGLLNN